MHVKEDALSATLGDYSGAAVDSSGRSAQKFRVEAQVKRGDRTRRRAAEGHDIYAYSAPLVCEALWRILDGQTLETGAHAPGALFDASHFLAAVERQASGKH